MGKNADFYHDLYRWKSGNDIGGFMSKKSWAIITIVFLGMIFLVAVAFKENGIREIRGVFTDKDALENVYYLMQVICSFAVVIGGMIGVWQYILAKRAEINQYHNSRIQKAIDLSEYYKERILCNITYIYNVYKESGILDILEEIKIENMIEFDMHELNKNFTIAQRNKIADITGSDDFLKVVVEMADVFLKKPVFDKPVFIKDGERIVGARNINKIKVMDYFRNDIICGTLNNLEFFSLHFNYEVADKCTVYQSLHKTYLEMVQMLYYDISVNNKTGEQKLYTNVIQLFSEWKRESEGQAFIETSIARKNIKRGNKARSVG